MPVGAAEVVVVEAKVVVVEAEVVVVEAEVVVVVGSAVVVVAVTWTTLAVELDEEMFETAGGSTDGSYVARMFVTVFGPEVMLSTLAVV